MRSRVSGFVVFVFVSVLAATAAAQNTPGRLTGLVTDAQGAILPGVGNGHIAVSDRGTEHGDAAGRQVPVSGTGDWSAKLVFELPVQKLTREGINVALGQTISVDAQLPLAR
jgi:hypothetical protein